MLVSVAQPAYTADINPEYLKIVFFLNLEQTEGYEQLLVMYIINNVHWQCVPQRLELTMLCKSHYMEWHVVFREGNWGVKCYTVIHGESWNWHPIQNTNFMGCCALLSSVFLQWDIQATLVDHASDTIYSFPFPHIWLAVVTNMSLPISKSLDCIFDAFTQSDRWRTNTHRENGSILTVCGKILSHLMCGYSLQEKKWWVLKEVIHQ